MRKHRLKLFFIICCFMISIFSIIVLNKEFASHEMKAASNYITGNQVYIGNESFTVIDPNTMTLLADQATEDGEMTWNNAVNSLNNLASSYGELGSKLVTGNFSLPRTNDLVSVTNHDQTALTTIPSIASDWWLGDVSVKNRSKFVGANSNSLVTEVSIVKNIIDTTNYVCLNDQTVTEQGIKPTKSEPDKTISDTIQIAPIITVRSNWDSNTSFDGSYYGSLDCSDGFGGGGNKSVAIAVSINTAPLINDSTLLASDVVNFSGSNVFAYRSFKEGGLDTFIRNYINDPSIDYKNKTFPLYLSTSCKVLPEAIRSKPENSRNKSYKVNSVVGNNHLYISSVKSTEKIECNGHPQTAGESSVRPMLTMDPNKISYSSYSKSLSNISMSLNQAVPEVNASAPYLTITDTDLSIGLDTNHSNVSGNKLSVHLSNLNSIVTIPVTLGGTTSGNRYVSAVAETNNGDQYGVLGTVNGTTGNVQLDISNIPNWQSTKTIPLTLYQEVDEGTNTTYRGNGTDITLELSLPTLTTVFTPSSSTFTYRDTNTVVNGTVGIFTLQYPNGLSAPKIASIQLGTSGDESHFSIDTTGTLKIKGADLDAGTYNVTVSGKDGNQMDFTKTVQIIVNKANQDNYQITNNANYNFQSNQEINITTSGNESGESETYTITNGNSIAQISNTNKFRMLSTGSFTLEATVGGNANYNPKTVTKQITLSQLPTQTNPIKISSGDSMMYGNMYTPTYTGGTGSGNVSWSIENDSGTGANLSNGSIKVTGAGTFTLKVTKAGDTNYQSSSDSKVITVNPRKTTVKPKDVTRKVGEVFKDNGVTYNPQPIAGDNLGTPIITSKYPTIQQAGRYTDGIQVTGLTNPNYDFEYQEGTLIINDTTLPNNGSGYYKITGTLGKNNWYISDIQISTTNKDGYDEISSDGINFQTTPITYHTDGDYPVTFYLKNSTTGIIAKGIQYQVKIDQTPPTVPTLTMNELNSSKMARLINFLSFGNWMNKSAEVVMSSTDGTSGIDNYTYIETDTKGTANTKTTTTGKVTYKNDVEIGITAKACDKAGNCSNLSASETLMIDRKAPDITGVKDQSVYKYYYLPRFVNVKDHGSGLSYAEYLKDGTQAGTIQENVSEKINGIGSYQVNAIDNAGNEASISFEIVPLPNIEDIDGSDESKDIIDQVKDEYEEIKDKLTDDEKKEYEDWINDAEEKWESERKKVIETDDKSAKVEGIGDTSFDPKTELIVDDISDQVIPPLPKHANYYYDVYLKKGNVQIQPNGDVKVYLPNVNIEKPVIYSIDENGKVKEIACKKENEYITFVTDQLTKYAIADANSETKCELNGIEINIDTNGDGKPDVNIDIDGDCKPDINIDTDGDGIPNTNIDTDLDGKPDYNIDTDNDGKPNVNIGPVNDPWNPNTCGIVNEIAFCTDSYKKPYLNIDSDGDGRPDINVDLDGDMEADINIDIDGDNIPDIDIDSDGDGKPDVNVDTDKDGKADKNIVKITEWKPDKNVDGSIPYDTMSNLSSSNTDSNNNENNGTMGPNMGGTLGSANTGDESKPFLWWIIVCINLCVLIYSMLYVKHEKDKSNLLE